MIDLGNVLPGQLEPHSPPMRHSLTAEDTGDQNYGALKQRLVVSPLVKGIYKVHYAVNKPLQGLSEMSNPTDGSFMTNKMFKDLSLPDPDSFNTDDGFDDLEEEMLKYTTKREEEEKAQQHQSNDTDVEMPDDYEPQLETIVVRVHENHIAVDQEDVFDLPATVRSCNVLPGASLRGDLYDEDSILITLSSQFLLLIRFFQHNGKVAPYVVQWWKTSHLENQSPTLTTVGHEILTHQSGSAVALTAQKDQIRLYYCSQTSRGVMLDRLQNLIVDGIILHSCFLEPLKDVPGGHAMFCILMMTSQRRYVIRLFEWWLDESRITEHTPLLLTNDFQVPVFILPFKQSIFMMMEKSIVLVGVNNILSADYQFLGADFPGSFPVSFFRPTTPIIAEDPDNEVLIATEDGTIFSVVIYEDRIHIRPILKVSRISKFMLEHRGSQYHLLYSRDQSSSGYMIFEDIVRDSTPTNKIDASLGELVFKWDNWAPLWDVNTIQTPEAEELWLGHGRYLSRLRIGLPATKELTDKTLRSAIRVFTHIANDSLYFIFGFTDHTLLFRLEDDSLVDIEDGALEMEDSTVHISSLDEICFQITDHAILAIDFSNQENLVIKDFQLSTIIMADCYLNMVALVSQIVIDDSLYTRLSIYTLLGGELNAISSDMTLVDEPNFVKLIQFEGRMYALTGHPSKFPGLPSKITFYEQSIPEFRPCGTFTVDLCDIHDLIAHQNTIHISGRMGEYAVYDLSSDLEIIQLKHLHTFKLAKSHIEFQLTPDHILLICHKQMWRLDFGAVYPKPIIFQEMKNRNIYSAISITGTKYAILRDDGFGIIDVSQQMQPIVKTLKIGKAAKKFKYISHLSVFAILTETTLLFADRHSLLEVRLFCRKENKVMFENEVLHCMAEWILPTEGKSFRNILIGCSSDSGGSIKVIQPKISKKDSNVMEAYEIYAIKTPAAVLSIGQISDTEIGYSCGSEFYRCKYNQQTKKMEEPVLQSTYSSLVTGFSRCGERSLFCTSGQLVSGHIDSFSDRGDVVVRDALDALVINDDLYVKSDHTHCCVSFVNFDYDHAVLWRSNLEYAPRVRKCELKSVWSESPVRRFLTFGIGGTIDVFTMLNEVQYESLQEYYQRSGEEQGPSVTMKGLWDPKTCWTRDQSHRRIFDYDRFTQGEDISEVAQSLLNNLSVY